MRRIERPRRPVHAQNQFQPRRQIKVESAQRNGIKIRNRASVNPWIGCFAGPEAISAAVGRHAAGGRD